MSPVYISTDFVLLPVIVGLSTGDRWSVLCLCDIASRFNHRRFTPRQLREYGMSQRTARHLVEYGWGHMDGKAFFFNPPPAHVRLAGPGRPQSKELPEPGGFTYVVQAGDDGPVKIGRTRGDVQTRVSALQTGSAEPLRVVCVLEGDHHEAILHDRFADWHISGEWFDKAILDELLAT